MKILLDYAATRYLQFCRESSVPGDDLRHYTSGAPARAILVFHNGLNPTSLVGAVVETEVSEAMGDAGDVRPGNEGQPHTLLTIAQRVNGPPDETLSRVLDGGLRDGV